MKYKIKKVEPILLSAPYATPDNMEVQLHLPQGYRTCGIIKITLENGLCGLGEAYLAVFAPYVFQEIVRLTAKYIEGHYLEEHISLMNDLGIVTGYWSRQGAARHILSAIDIAFYDLLSRIDGKPLYKYLNKEATGSLNLYASGGDSCSPVEMCKELDKVSALGIKTFKIRARKEHVNKANWCLRNAKDRNIQIAIDMTQNLMEPGQTVDDVLSFCDSLTDIPAFIEEPLGPSQIHKFPLLRKQSSIKIAGGEIITHPQEMIEYIQNGYYDIAQPDAIVIGGISALEQIFNQTRNVQIYVHCWGGPVGMLANYHTAAAFGGSFAEWPLPQFSLRENMLLEPWNIHTKTGTLHLPNVPGLGVILTDEIIETYPFRQDAVYNCLPSKNQSPDNSWKYQ